VWQTDGQTVRRSDRIYHG